MMRTVKFAAPQMMDRVRLDYIDIFEHPRSMAKEWAHIVAQKVDRSYTQQIIRKYHAEWRSTFGWNRDTII